MILQKTEEKFSSEIQILKGKALYHSYQGSQRVYLKLRSSMPAKTIEPFKSQFYRKALECIRILGHAHDNKVLDDEGSELLDHAMVDYAREMNGLKDCKRCLLCRHKKEVRRSHIIPKSILKEVANDLMVDSNDHKVFVPLIGKNIKKSAGEATFWLLCAECEERLSKNGENQFMESVYRHVCPGRRVKVCEIAIQYGPWFYTFCIGILFRALAISSQFGTANDADLYLLFTFCRNHLLSLSSLHSIYGTDESHHSSDVSTKQVLNAYFLLV